MKPETRKFLLNHPFLLGANEEGEDEYMDEDEHMFKVLGSMLEEYAATHQEGRECYVECEQETELHLVESYPNQQTGRLVSYLQKKPLPQISEEKIDRLWDKYCDTAHEAPEWMFKEHFKAAIIQLMKGGEG